MAFSVTDRGDNANGSTASPTLTLPGFQPTADSLILFVGAGQENYFVNGDPLAALPTSSGYAWVAGAEIEGTDSPHYGDPATNSYELTHGIYHASDDGSATGTITWDGSDNVDCFYSIGALDITGHDPTTPFNQWTAPATTDQNNGSDSVSLDVTFSAGVAIGNLVVVSFAATADNGGGFAAPTIGGQPMTPVWDTAQGFCQACVYYREITGDETNYATGPTITCTDLGQAVGGGTAIAVEINAAAAGGEVTAVLDATWGGWSASALFGTPVYPASISGTQLRDQHNNVFLLNTLSSWGMYRRTRTEITGFLEDVAANGAFRGVTVFFGGGYDLGGVWSNPYQNGDGEDFWSGTPWQSTFGIGWDTYDHIVDECLRLGLTVSISIGVAFGATGAQAEIEAATDAQMVTVGEAMATRYPVASYPNVIWHIMFDDANTTGSTIGSRIDSYFEGIGNVEGSARPIRWVENAQGQSTIEAGWFEQGNSLFTINTEYDYGDDAARIIDDARADTGASGKPIGDCEPPYVGAPHYGGIEWQQLRERTAAVFIRGGMLINFGHEDIWPFGETGLYTAARTWDNALAHTPVVEQSYMMAWIQQYVADSSWAASSWVTAGEETGDLRAAVGNSNTCALAYFPDSRTGIEIDTTVLAGSGNVAIRWLDPTTGAVHTVVTADEAQQTGRSVTYPTVSGRATGNAGSTDLLLLVELITPPAATVPAAVDDLAATPAGSGAVDLAWTAPADGGSPIIDYIVEYRALDGTYIGGTVAQENALTGTALPQITGYGDTSNQGFARPTSVNTDEIVEFCVTGDCEQIDIYRIGHYAGTGARLVATLTNTATTQPAPTTIADSNGGVECQNWSATASWRIPGDALSGLYIAHVRNAALTDGSWIAFCVRNDSRTADIVVGIPFSTWGCAYNWYGGKNLYGSGAGVGTITERTHAVSLERPVNSRGDVVNHWDDYDLAAIDYLEEQGFDVKYVFSHDLETPARFNDAAIYISVGHDEYWSEAMYDAVEAHRDAGGHSVWLSGNDVFWKVRFEDNYRTMWCYKDTMPGPGVHVAGDPLDPVVWTGTWRDGRWVDRRPENLLHGTTFRMNGINYFAATVVAATYGSSPFWRDTAVQDGPTDLVVTDAIGFEANSMDAPGDWGQVVLAATTHNIDGSFADNNGQTYTNNGDLAWGILMTQASAGAGVAVHFGAMAWCWALSDSHDGGSSIENAQVRQAVANLLYDLGATADTLDVALTTPTPVTDVITDYGVTVPPVTAFVWQGSDPTEIIDLGDYELGTRFQVDAGGQEITGARIWNTGYTSVTSRVLRLWDNTGTEIVDGTFPFAIDDILPTYGWNEYTFPAPYVLAAGTYTMSYAVGDGISNGYGAAAFVGYSQGNITLLDGRFNDVPSLYPNQVFGNFYGIDIEVGSLTPTAPSDPTSVGAVAGEGQVVVTWTDAVTGYPAPTYTIERRIGAGAWSALTSGIASGIETYTDTTVVNGTTYRYRVQATNSEGASAWVETGDVTPAAPSVVWFEYPGGSTPGSGADTAQYTLGQFYTADVQVEITHVRVWMPAQNTVTNRTLYLTSGPTAAGGSSYYNQAIPDTLQAGWNDIELTTPSTWNADGTVYGILVDVGNGSDTLTYGLLAGAYASTQSDGTWTGLGGGFAVGHDTYPTNFNTTDYFLYPGRSVTPAATYMGYDEIGTLTSQTADNWQHQAYRGESGLTHVAVSDDVVTELGVYGQCTSGVRSICEVGVYTVNASTDAVEDLVGSAPILVDTTLGWHTVQCHIPLTAGVEYTTAIRYDIDQSTDAWTIRYETNAVPAGGHSSATAIGAAAFQDPWVEGSTSTAAVSYRAKIENSPSFSPLSIDWNAVLWADDPGFAAPSDGADIPYDPTDHAGTVWTRRNTTGQTVKWRTDMGGTGKPAFYFPLATGVSGPALEVTPTMGNATYVFMVAKGYGAFADFCDNTNGAFPGRRLLQKSSGAWMLYAGAVLSGGTNDENVHAFYILFDPGGNDVLDVDGVNVLDGNAGAENFDAGFAIGATDSNTEHSGSEVAFCGIKDSPFTAQEMTDLLAWAAAEYGI